MRGKSGFVKAAAAPQTPSAVAVTTDRARFLSRLLRDIGSPEQSDSPTKLSGCLEHGRIRQHIDRMADGATDGAMTQIPRTHGRGSRQWVRTSIRTKLFSW